MLTSEPSARDLLLLPIGTQRLELLNSDSRTYKYKLPKVMQNTADSCICSQLVNLNRLALVVSLIKNIPTEVTALEAV